MKSLPSRCVEISKPVRAVAYRAKVQPFDSVKFLDMRALSRARRATVEIGTVETKKGAVTIAANIRNGSIVSLAPKGCAGCLPRKGKKLNKSKAKAVLRALDSAGLRKLGGASLPIKLRPGVSLARRNFGLVIINIDIHWFDLCITWKRADGTICIFCIFGAFTCVDVITGAG
jgi:hypothetical protein